MKFNKTELLTVDRATALLAIGAAIADKEMAKELNLDGIPDRNLQEFAAAVKTMQDDSKGQEQSDATTVINAFLQSLVIIRSNKVSVRKQLVDSANQWALYERGKTWMRKAYGQFLRPKGSRLNAIERFKELGFTE